MAPCVLHDGDGVRLCDTVGQVVVCGHEVLLGTFGFSDQVILSLLFDSGFPFQLGMPFQQFPVEVRVYYYVQVGRYMSLLYSLSSDTKRKDFTEVFKASGLTGSL